MKLELSDLGAGQVEEIFEDLVLAVGRDNGSGTRITQLAETKYGVFTPVQQWKLTGTTAITVAQLWPVGDGVGSFAAGNGGYTSGSTIRTFMGLPSPLVELRDETGASVATDLPLSFIANRQEITLRRPLYFVLTCGVRDAAPSLSEVTRLLDDTVAGWRQWAKTCALPTFAADKVLRARLERNFAHRLFIGV